MNYKLIYDNLCDRGKSENRTKGNGVYYEAHHILPKSLGGEGLVNQYKWHHNVVLLTDKEHFLAHRLLCKIYPDNKQLRYAWWAMCNQKASNQGRLYNVSARAYSEARKLFIDSFSGENHPLHGKGYLQAGEKNPLFGRPQSEESKQRKRESSIKSWQDPKLRQEQSERLTGIKRSEETKLKMSKPKSDEHKRKLQEHLLSIPAASQATKDLISKNHNSRIKHLCIFCGVSIGGIGNFNRHQKVQHGQ